MSENSEKVLWKFSWYYGEVESYFVATRAEVAAKIGTELVFGEILGKHSDVRGILQESDIKEVSTDQGFIAQFAEMIGSTGDNPMHAYECDNCGSIGEDCCPEVSE